MKHTCERGDRKTNRGSSQAPQAQPEQGRDCLEDSAADPPGLGAGSKHPGRKEFCEADSARRNQAIVNLVAHWRLAGSNFGSALADDPSVLFALERADVDTLGRLALRIASGALLADATR